MGYIGHTPNWTAPTAAPPISGADITDDSLESVKIKAGTIVDSDINASAGIVISKLAVDPTNADNIGSGTLPDARFPAILPAKSGVNLTALNATQLTSGTLPDARFGALPAVSGANLTSLTAGNITGVVPAANLGTGTANSGTFLNGAGAYSEAGGGAWNIISTTTASSSSTIDITSGLTSTYSTYVFMLTDIICSAETAVYFRITTDGGSSWLMASHSWRNVYYSSIRNAHESEAMTGGNNFHLYDEDNIKDFSTTLHVSNPSQTTSYKHLRWNSCGNQTLTGDKETYGVMGYGQYIGATNAINGFRFYPSTGNFTSGRVTLYGIAHA